MYTTEHHLSKNTHRGLTILLIAAATTAVVILTLYAFFIEPNRLTTRQMTIKSGLPGSPVTMAQVSDLHLSSIRSIERNVIATLQKENPDLILFTGDVIDNATSLDELDTFLSMLPAQPVKIAVLGNWEYWSGVNLQRLATLYQKHSVQLLVNRSLPVRNMTIIGLDDYTAGKPDYDAAKASYHSTNPIVVIQHSPGFFSDPHYKADRGIIVNLAGHTHGGQVALFGKGLVTPQGSGPFDSGWYKTKWGLLFVSKGVGTSVLPIRFGSKPEVVLFTLD